MMAPLYTALITALALLSPCISASPIDNSIAERQTELGVRYGLGQLNVVTSPSPFLEIAANGGTYQYILSHGRCVIDIFFYYPGGAPVQQGVVGGIIQDCNPPNYGRLVFQDVGNFYIARNDDPNQVLFQSQTSTAAQGVTTVRFNPFKPWVDILGPSNNVVWSSSEREPPPPGPCDGTPTNPFCPGR